MIWTQWAVLGFLSVIVLSLLFTRIKPVFLFAGVALVSFLSGMTPLPALMENFTNPSLLTLVLLVLVSTALEKTRLISWVGRNISQGGQSSAVAKLGLSTAFLSSFTNNTAVVVSLISAIKRNPNHAPSKLLLPLSYTAILGGTLTLIGTSTNLIINSFVEDVGLPSLHFFTPTLIGLAVLMAGLVILIPLSHFLPDHDETHQDELPYFLEARVESNSPLIGKSVKENGLRNLRRLFLAEMVRNGQTVAPVCPDTPLQEGDRLLFCGDVESVASLQDIQGLRLFGQHHLNGQNLQEVVISHSASIRGQTLKTAQFREQFDAVVVAIRRGHERLAGGLGNIELHAGDILVIVPGKRFHQQKASFNREFVQVNGLDSSARLDSGKSIFVLLGFLVTVVFALTGVFPLIKGLAIYLLLLLVSRIVSLSELKRRFPMEIVVIVGAALSLAQLMISSGLSDRMGSWFMSVFNGWGMYGGLIAVYFLALILTELITNNAAAALTFPIAYSLALSYHSDPMPFIMAILFGASASFISPYGYQTNLLVYRVGNYRLTDYIKIGLPLSLVYSIVVLSLIPIFFPF